MDASSIERMIANSDTEWLSRASDYQADRAYAYFWLETLSSEDVTDEEKLILFDNISIDKFIDKYVSIKHRFNLNFITSLALTLTNTANKINEKTLKNIKLNGGYICINK